jgi:hypothetical protein
MVHLGTSLHEPSIDLLRPSPALVADAEALETARYLNTFATINPTSDRTHFTWGSWQRAKTNPYVTPHGQRVLDRMAGYFQARVTQIPGLPSERISRCPMRSAR